MKFKTGSGYIISYACDGYMWCKLNNMIPHRVVGPAIINSFNAMFWYKDGVLHRDNGPAAEYETGLAFFYLDGLKHSKEDYWERVNNEV